MANEEKVRTSGDIPRNESAAPMLPTVNPAAEKPAPAPASFHPAVYIA